MPIADSDILYLYDAKLTNPNGDPDGENRPRMDEATGRNLVSDVRLKRYLRDFWLNTDKDVWVRRTPKGYTTDAKKRMQLLLGEFNGEKGTSLKEKDARGDADFKNWRTIVPGWIRVPKRTLAGGRRFANPTTSLLLCSVRPASSRRPRTSNASAVLAIFMACQT